VLSLNSLRQELPTDCEILAVSKLQSVEKIRKLYTTGQRLFAENYVQEAVEKQKQLADLKIEWHFIGHLQKNKAKLVVGNFTYIHSVDSLELAQTLDHAARMKNLTQKIFVQINLAREESKGGIHQEDLSHFLEKSAFLGNIQVVGLMTMPPLFDDPQRARPFFRELRELLKIHQAKCPQLQKLSMGTSSDYRIAAEEGSTIVRLGTILFGERLK